MVSLKRATVSVTIGAALAALALLLTGVRAARADPGVIYVDADAPGPAHDGLSWTTAYTNVQNALVAAVYGDEIWVAEGVYYPDQGAGQVEDERTSTFMLTQGIAIYGGFGGYGVVSETQRDQRDWTAHVTILSGDVDGDDTNTDGNHIAETWADIQGNNAYHVVTGGGVTQTARLDGFTITAGYANGSEPHWYGGGMYNNASSPTLANLTFSGNQAIYGGGMSNDASSPTLTDVAFSGNHAIVHGGGMSNDTSSPTLADVTLSDNSADYGGGMYNTFSSPVMTGATFSDNSADDGGGMYNYFNSSPTLTGVTFSDNQATDYGGGMYNSSSSPTLTDVAFSGNYADYGGGMHNISSSPTLTGVAFSDNQASYGGGLYNSFSSPTLTDVAFSGNQATSRGGGMYNWNGSNPTLTNVTFSGNQATSWGGGMYNSSSSPALTNVAFSGNQATSRGGGMYNNTSSPALTNVAFSGNQAASSGGGVYNYASDPTLTSVTFSGNQAANSGGGMYNDWYSSPTLVNCILWDDSAASGPEIYDDDTSAPTVVYSDVQWPGGVYTGTGNLNADPLFVLPITATLAPTTTGNYRLRAGSPAIDAGNNLSVTVSTDFDGHPRIVGGTVDLGAYEKTLFMTKQVTPTTDVPYHGVVTYTVVLTNANTLSETGVLFTDTLPVQVDFARWAGAPPPGASVAGDVVAWTGIAPASGGITFTFVATHTSGYSDVVTNTADVGQAALQDRAEAVFTVIQGYPLRVSKSGNGGGAVVSDPSGIDCGATCVYTYSAGALVTLTATPLISSTFVAWSGDVTTTTNPVTLTMDAPQSVTATFALKTYVITPTAGAGGSITPATPQTVSYGGEQAFGITPDVGYHIADVGVDGASVGAVSAYTFTHVTANHTIAAAFAIDAYTLTIATAGDGSGIVTPTVGAHVYAYGAVVTLTATPLVGSTFAGWSGDSDCADGVVAMDDSKACTATFTFNTYTLTIATTGNGSGVVTPTVGAHVYAYGAVVTLTATPLVGSTFAGWSGDCSGAGACVVTMTAARQVTATFELAEPAEQDYYIFLPLILKNTP